MTSALATPVLADSALARHRPGRFDSLPTFVLPGLVDAVLELLPAELTSAPHFDRWTDLLHRTIGRCLCDVAIQGSRSQEAWVEAPEQEAHPVVDRMAGTSAEVQVLHRFDEDELVIVDALITAVRDRMRLHANHRLFEGEEILAAWLSEAGVQLPQALPSIGRHSQGGYFMHMSGDARQSAHLHGVMRADGSTVAGTGGRFLIGLFGAHASTIRHPGGVIRVPRGALAIVHFPQTEAGPTAHQFWNEDGEPGVGNLLFSFHAVDLVPQDAVGSEAGSEMMSKRSFDISEQAAAEHPAHGFIF